jgi:hypothetical protein
MCRYCWFSSSKIRSECITLEDLVVAVSAGEVVLVEVNVYVWRNKELCVQG